MAITLDGTLSTLAGATTSSYIRIEYIKYMPYAGLVEYNPMLFKNETEADISRIRYFGDDLPTSMLPIPHTSMSFEPGSFSSDFELNDIMVLPLSGALQNVSVDHYGIALQSASIEVTDFDDDGNEIVTQEIMKWQEFSVISQSIEERHPLDLSRSGSILSQCYEHLKNSIAEQIPSGSILEI